MEVAKFIVAVILGFIAAVVVYPYFNAYVIALLAFLGAIAVGAIVYVVVERILNALLARYNR